jgi:hypothetical protein
MIWRNPVFRVATFLQKAISSGTKVSMESGKKIGITGKIS